MVTPERSGQSGVKELAAIIPCSGRILRSGWVGRLNEMELSAIVKALDTYVKPQTSPLGLKMFAGDEELPAKVKLAGKDLGKRVAICQAFSMARKYGWTVAVSKEDQSCPIGSVVLGFQPAVDFYTEGNLCDGMYTINKAAGANSEAKVLRFPEGKFRYLVVGPLERIDFRPDLVLVYGSPAQVMRLVQGALYIEGGNITSTFSGRAECSETVVQTLNSGKCQVVLPGNGERVFGQTQDHELAFTMPWSEVEKTLEGLAATHKGGVRYPIPAWLNYQVTFPPKYQKLEELWSVTGLDKK